MVKGRNYAIDLLKIVSMYMICILHIFGQGGVLGNLEAFTLEYNLAWFLEMLCYVSVNCYAIITGYLMIDSKFRYKKIIDLWIGVVFWSLLLTLVMKGIYPDLIGKKMIVMSLFPVVFSEYWYFNAYFGVFLFIPFFNKLINSIDNNMFKRLVVTIILLFCFINLVTDPFKLNSGYSFLWLVGCYFIGAYIKKTNLFSKIKSRYLFLGTLFFISITFIFKLLIVKFPFLTFDLFGENMLLRYNSFTILFASVCLFILFLRMKINNKYFKRFIKRLAPATFGVYIIHVHPRIWGLFMWKRFEFILSYDPIQIILLVLGFSFMLYMLCSYMEMIRIYLFKKLKINKISDIIYNKLRTIMSWLKLI